MMVFFSIRFMYTNNEIGHWSSPRRPDLPRTSFRPAIVIPAGHQQGGGLPGPGILTLRREGDNFYSER